MRDWLDYKYTYTNDGRSLRLYYPTRSKHSKAKWWIGFLLCISMPKTILRAKFYSILFFLSSFSLLLLFLLLFSVFFSFSVCCVALLCLILLWLLTTQTTTTTTFISYCNGFGIHGVFAYFGVEQPIFLTTIEEINRTRILSLPLFLPSILFWVSPRWTLFAFVYLRFFIHMDIFCGQTHIWNAMRCDANPIRESLIFLLCRKISNAGILRTIMSFSCC